MFKNHLCFRENVLKAIDIYRRLVEAETFLCKGIFSNSKFKLNIKIYVQNQSDSIFRKYIFSDL